MRTDARTYSLSYTDCTNPQIMATLNAEKAMMNHLHPSRVRIRTWHGLKIYLTLLAREYGQHFSPHGYSRSGEALRVELAYLFVTRVLCLQEDDAFIDLYALLTRY